MTTAGPARGACAGDPQAGPVAAAAPLGWELYARFGAVAAAVVLPLVEMTRVAVDLPAAPEISAAVISTAIYLPLHVRHVLAALDGHRAAHGTWTLALMAIAVLAPLPLLGTAWALPLATLVVSCVLILKPPWSLTAAAGLVLLSYVVGTERFGPPASFQRDAIYLPFTVAFRAGCQIAIVSMAAMVRQLRLTRSALAEQAVRDQRRRIRDDLRKTLLDDARQLAGAAADADDRVRRGDASARDALTALVSASRQQLHITRQVVARYRGSTDVEQLTEAGRLLRGHAAAGTSMSRVRGIERVGTGEVVTTRRRALTLLILVHALTAVFLLFNTLGIFSLQPPSIPAFLLLLAALALQLRLAFAVAAGRMPAAPRTSMLLTCAAASLVFLLVGNPAPEYWLVAASVALTLGRWRWTPALLAGLLLGAVAYATFRPEAGPPLPTATAAWIVCYTSAVLLLGAGALVATPVLARTATELAADRRALAQRAVEEERLRLSRDLHDVLGHSLSAITLKGDLALALLARDPVAAATETGSIRTVAAGLAAELGDVAAADRPISLDAEYRGTVHLLREAGITVRGEISLEALPPEVDAVFGWTLREGATNILRHSAAATVIVAPVRIGDLLGIELINDGVEEPPAARGSGLAGLRERARTLGGAVSTETIEGGWFRLRVLVPSAASMSHRADLVEGA